MVRHALVASLAALVASSCGQSPRGELASRPPDQQIAFSGVGISAASPSGDAFVYLEGNALVRVRDGAIRRVALEGASCHPSDRSVATDTSFLVVWPQGSKALLYGARTNIDFDLWGHSGLRLAISCLVDIDAGRAAPLEAALPGAPELHSAQRADFHAVVGPSGRLYTWASPREITALDLASQKSVSLGVAERFFRPCTLVETTHVLTTACLGGDDPASQTSLDVTTFDPSAWPPRQTDRFAIPLPASALPREGGVLSPDARFYAWHEHSTKGAAASASTESTLHVLSLERRAMVLTKKETHEGAIRSLAFDPQGRGVLVGDDLSPGTARVRLVGWSGAVLDAFAVKGGAQRLTPVGSGERVWVSGLVGAALVPVSGH
ncbi:Hypothetical protein A7982_02157 [Minicystis rosea]|nr:Hypothetical protein A7982_02157 [Minicystis rosea]